MVQAEIQKHISLFVGEQELLGIIGQDAKPVDALVDHAVEHPLLAV